MCNSFHLYPFHHPKSQSRAALCPDPLALAIILRFRRTRSLHLKTYDSKLRSQFAPTDGRRGGHVGHWTMMQKYENFGILISKWRPRGCRPNRPSPMRAERQVRRRLTLALADKDTPPTLFAIRAIPLFYQTFQSKPPQKIKIIHNSILAPL